MAPDWLWGGLVHLNILVRNLNFWSNKIFLRFWIDANNKEKDNLDQDNHNKDNNNKDNHSWENLDKENHIKKNHDKGNFFHPLFCIGG